MRRQTRRIPVLFLLSNQQAKPQRTLPSPSSNSMREWRRESSGSDMLSVLSGERPMVAPFRCTLRRSPLSGPSVISRIRSPFSSLCVQHVSVCGRGIGA